MTPELITVLMVGAAIGLIILGYPIAFVLGGLATVVGLIFVGPTTANLFMLRLYGLLQNYVLLAIPLFVFMGFVIEQTGIAARMYEGLRLIVGWLPGGLALATIVTGTIFAAGTGVVGASVITLGLVALPSMLQNRYGPTLATGTVCATGTLGIIIPPSIMIVVYGPMAGLSVGQLFMATIMPGLLLATLFMIYVFLRCAFNPSLGRSAADLDAAVPWGRRIYTFCVSVLPIGVLIFMVLGSIFFGVAAPTEAAGVGAFGALLLAAAYGKFNLVLLRQASRKTLEITCMIYLVTIGASFFTGVFVRIGGRGVVENVMMDLPFAAEGIIAVMLLVVFILGMFIDWIGILMITVPIFTPIAASLGVDPIWFSVMMMLVLQSSYLTPPFALSVFYLKGVTPKDVTTMDLYRGILPFIAIQFVAIGLMAYFPQIILWLPSLTFAS